MPHATRRLLFLSVLALLIAACRGDKSVTGTPAPSTMYAVAHSGLPAMTNYGGPVLSSIRLVVITAQNETQHDSLVLFARDLTVSSWWSNVAQAYALDPAPTLDTVTGPALSGAFLGDTGIAKYIHAAVDGTPDAPDGHSLYLVFLPSGAYVNNSAGSCGPNGYHNMLDPADVYVVVQRCPGDPTARLMGQVASHYIANAATDPFFMTWGMVSSPPSGTYGIGNPFAWTDPNRGGYQEAGDLCEGSNIIENGWEYIRIYSSAAATTGGDPCIPQTGAPYWNTSTAPGFHRVGRLIAGDGFVADSSLSIPVTGWSTAAVPDWWVRAVVYAYGGRLPKVTIVDSTLALSSTGVTEYAINNGRTLTVTVSYPTAASSGEWAVIGIQSFMQNASQYPPALDFSHVWMVGVYVP